MKPSAVAHMWLRFVPVVLVVVFIASAPIATAQEPRLRFQEHCPSYVNDEFLVHLAESVVPLDGSPSEKRTTIMNLAREVAMSYGGEVSRIDLPDVPEFVIRLKGELVPLLEADWRIAGVEPDCGSESVRRERLLREIYGTLSGYTAGSGKAVEFELTAFREIHPSEFSETQLQDVLTLTYGPLLRFDRQRIDDASLGPFVAYDVAWDRPAPDGPEVSLVKGAEEMTITDLIAEAAALLSEENELLLPAIRSMTSYTVSAGFSGRSRSYRAAVLWLEEALPGDYAFLLADTIATTGVHSVLRERLPAKDEARLLAAKTELHGLEAKAPTPADPIVSKAGETCHAIERVEEQFLDTKSTNEHSVQGFHQGAANFEFTCACETDCALKCIAQVKSNGNYCWEFLISDNWPWTTHSFGGEHFDIALTRIPDGHLKEARCVGGYVCTIKKCVLGFCSLAGFSFSRSGGTSVSIQLQPPSQFFGAVYTPDWTCNKCQLSENPAGGGSCDLTPCQSECATKHGDECQTEEGQNGTLRCDGSLCVSDTVCAPILTCVPDQVEE